MQQILSLIDKQVLYNAFIFQCPKTIAFGNQLVKDDQCFFNALNSGLLAKVYAYLKRNRESTVLYYLTFMIAEALLKQKSTLTLLANENQFKYNKQIDECIFISIQRILSARQDKFQTEAILHNDILAKKHYYCHTYSLCKKQTQNKIIKQLKLAVLTPNCLMLDFAMVMLYRWMYHLTATQFTNHIINSNFFAQIKELVTTKNVEKFGCKYGAVPHECRYRHCIYLLVLMGIILQAGSCVLDSMIVNTAVIKSNVLQSLFLALDQTDTSYEEIREEATQIEYEAYLFGIFWMFGRTEFQNPYYYKCIRYLLRDTIYIKLLCQMVSRQPKNGEMVSLFAQYIFRIMFRFFEPDEHEWIHDFLATQFEQYLNIDIQTIANTLALSRLLPCGQCTRFLTSFILKRTPKNLFSLLATVFGKNIPIDVFTMVLDATEQFSLIIDDIDHHEWEFCNQIASLCVEHGLCIEHQYIFHKYTIKHYGIDILDEEKNKNNIGMFGILQYFGYVTANNGIQNKTSVNLLPLMERPPNRQSVRLIRTSMLQFAKNILKKSNVDDAQEWYCIARILIGIYSFFYINQEYVKNDLEKVVEYLQCFVINFMEKELDRLKMTKEYYCVESEKDRCAALTNFVNIAKFILCISYAVTGNEEKCWDNFGAEMSDVDTEAICEILTLVSGGRVPLQCDRTRHIDILIRFGNIITRMHLENHQLRDNITVIAYKTQSAAWMKQIVNQETRNQVLYSKWRNTTTVRSCSVCKKNDKPLRKCKKCKKRLYCSKKCQKIDWNTNNHCAQCL